ncbi:MAG: hypothetical protein R3B47_17700 [Bacteroidia bacterium]
MEESRSSMICWKLGDLGDHLALPLFVFRVEVAGNLFPDCRRENDEGGRYQNNSKNQQYAADKQRFGLYDVPACFMEGLVIHKRNTVYAIQLGVPASKGFTIHNKWPLSVFLLQKRAFYLV